MNNVPPIPANFGTPDPRHVVGRDELLDELRTHVTHGTSLLLTGERRMGKSWIAHALVAAPPPGWTPVYADVENVSSVRQLRDVMAGRLVEKLPIAEKVIEHLRQTGEWTVRGVPVPRPTTQGDEEIRRLVRGLTQTGTRLLFVLDELPIMAQTVAGRDRAESLELLRMLRALRHEDPGVRMVCSGSIGFHHVLGNDAEVRAAVNDLHRVPVGPLSRAGATLLARRLLAGIGVVTSHDDPVAAAMADATDGVPFYLHKIVTSLDARRRAGLGVDVDAVWSARDAALADPDDPWELDHYRNRVGPYFGSDEPLAVGILDAVALGGDDGLNLDVLVDRLAADEIVTRRGSIEREQVRAVVQRLFLDHYLDLVGDPPKFRFRLRILRDAWRRRRFLE